MKFDKEWLLKNQFWLLLGGVGLLWLVALCWLLFFIGDPVADKKKAFEDAEGGVSKLATNSGPSKPKNNDFVTPWNAYGDKFKSRKNTVWDVAWSGDPGDLESKDAEVKDKDKLPEGVKARHVYSNAAWEVTLLFDHPEKSGWRILPGSSIKNVSRRNQALATAGLGDGVRFRLVQGDANPTLVYFAGEGDKKVLAPDKTLTLGDSGAKNGLAVEGGDPAQPMRLQLVAAEPWSGQAAMYNWPDDAFLPNGNPGDGKHLLNQELLSPVQTFSAADREWYKGTDPDSSPYRGQFKDLYNELHNPRLPNLPLDGVSFKESDPSKREDAFYTVMGRIDINSPDVHVAPDPEECWLMQEDFWVKREVLYVVRDALDMAAHLDGKDAEVSAPLPEGVKARHVYSNASWEVTLLFDQKGPSGSWRVRPDSTIKNIHVSRRDQYLGVPSAHNGGVWFRLRQGDDRNKITSVAFEGKPLAWNQSAILGAEANENGFAVKGGADPMQPMDLDQLFDGTNTPIKVVDEITISKVSHRNANRALVAAKPERYGLKAAATPPPGSATPPVGGGNPNNPNGGGTPGSPGLLGGAAVGSGGGAGGMNNGTASNTKTANYGVEKNRYFYVTDQSRHLPVAVTLTVDQSHLHEVLAAFANSRLRFEVTQVEFRRVPAAPPSTTSTQQGGGAPFSGGTQRGPSGAGAGPGAGAGAPPPPAGGTSGNMRNPNNPNGGAAGASGLSGSTGNPSSGNEADVAPPDNPNMIEVTIYGLASLYERPTMSVKGRVKATAADKITLTVDNKDMDVLVGPNVNIVVDGKEGKALDDVKKDGDATVLITIGDHRAVKIESGGGGAK
ncbi:MAG TPA: hypothetical protein VMS17_24125 [Gemmataceae bacterium]|nr:hypothetical protein [Gemmataceae bacterium]